MFITLSGYPKFPFDEDTINPETYLYVKEGIQEYI